MKNGGSPLRKMWDGRRDEQEWGLIVINDDGVDADSHVLNFIFSRIRDYEYNAHGYCGNPLQRLAFWKNIRSFIEFKHQEIMRDINGELRCKVLSSLVYQYACLQEASFSKLK
jgi:hypothetical protein